MTKQRIG